MDSISKIVVPQNNFIEQDLIGNGVFSMTYLALQSDTRDKYAKKYLNNVSISCNEQNLISFFDSLSKINYQCFVPPSFISIYQNKPIIYTLYAENKSLQYIVQQQLQGKFVTNYDNTQEYLILYGISHFLESYHKDKKVHGSIKLSNVLLNDNFFPFVSDPSLYQIINKPSISTLKNKTIDYLVSLSPEEISNKNLTQFSDIYSFGILILQVLTHKINVFTNDDTNIQQIEQMILNNTSPEIPHHDSISPELSKILTLCFSSEPEKRPTATSIKKVFEEILSSERYERRFNIFKNSMPYQELTSTDRDIDLEPIDPKQLRTLWAIDCSESVRENQFYHNALRRVVNEYYKKTDEIYLWDNNYKKISYEELNNFMSHQQGFNGTKSSLIAEISNESSIREHLMIITDGSVDPGEIDRSDQLMRRYRIKFKFVSVFIILDENPPELQQLQRQYNLSDQELDNFRTKCNLSVGAPYSRGCQNATYYIKKPGVREELTSLNHKDIASLKNINSIDSYEKFVEEFDHLDHAIQAMTLGKDGNSDPLIYLQIKSGLSVKYGVSIVIDPCFTCFEDFSLRKPLQTIGVIQSAISKLDLAFFDLIVSDNKDKEPRLIYTEKEKIILAQQAKEKFVESLFEAFKNPNEKVDLIQSINKAIELKKNRKTEYKCIILVLTKNCMIESDIDLIVKKICEQKDISIFGIGDGIYPKNTEKQYPEVVFNPDPISILTNIAPHYQPPPPPTTDKHHTKTEKYDPKNMNTVWAIDASESVLDNEFYHIELEKIIDEYYKDNDEICLWHRYLRKINKKELEDFIKNRRGFEGTKSSMIAHISYHTNYEHLLIVTDGTVDYGEIDESDKLVKKFGLKFKFVTVFIIHDENPPLIQRLRRDYKDLSEEELDNYRLKCDLSVAVPYTRGRQSVTFLIKKHNQIEKLASLTPKDIDALNNIGDIKDYKRFNRLFGNLDKAIQNLTIGKEKDSGLSGQLDSLYERIKNSKMSIIQKNDFEKKFNQLKRMADGALRKALGINEIVDAKKGT